MHYGDMRSCDEGATRMDELDYELWHACAGPLTSLPPVESLVMYWPQGHIEQVCERLFWFFSSGDHLSVLVLQALLHEWFFL